MIFFCCWHLPFFFQFTLYTDHPLADGVDGKAPQIRRYPLAVQLGRHGGGGAGAAEEISHTLTDIAQNSDQSASQANDVAQASLELLSNGEQLQQTINQFKV